MNAPKLLRRLALATATIFTSAVMLGSMAAPAQAATPLPTTYFFGGAYIEGNGYTRTTTVGNNGVLKLDAGVGSYYYRGHKAAPKLSLQRKVAGGKWVTVKSGLKLTAKGQIKEVATPKYSTSKTKVTISYRFKSAAYTSGSKRVSGTDYSPTLKVTYENQRAYTGFKQELYQIVRPYCPATAVHVRNGSTGEAGHYQTGSLLINVSPEAASYPTDFRAAIALHECAHERQFVNWGSTSAGWSKMKVAMAKHFVNDAAPAGAERQEAGDGEGSAFDAVEHAADCASHAIDPLGYLGYGGYCNASELAAGRSLITGHKL